MNKSPEHRDRSRIWGRKSVPETLRQDVEFSEPSGPRGDHDHSNDHIALVYETRDEQFASAIPFISRGLERGERCLYVADDNVREDILAAMREYGIDVDAAVESGALSILEPADTYRRTGEFDRSAMLEFWEKSLEWARDEEGYSGLRAAAEMTWALDADTSVDEVVEYEAMLNPLYEDDDYTVMCQYNRERFPAAVIHDVVKTHPLVVSDGTVSENFYYTPPERFFGSEETEAKVDRMLGTLQERTAMKTELTERREHLERIFESSHDAILVVDPEADEIVDANPAATEMLGYAHDELLTLGPSDVHPDELDTFQSFVDEVFENDTGWIDELACRTKGRGRIPVEVSASRMEHDGRPAMLAVVRDVSERRKWERALRRLYGITSDPDRTFDEKLGAVFELGCEHFDLDVGGIARVDPEADLFEVETISGEHDSLVPGEQYSLSETYCRLVSEDGETAAVTDPIGQGFEGKQCYEQFDVHTYLGAYLGFTDDDDRTFFFLSNQPREREFSEAERTFHDLMGQWVKYELERQQRERELERVLDLLEKTEQVADVGGWEIDVETQDVFWSDHIFELLEVDADEEPTLEEALAMYHEEDQPIVEDAVQQALDSGESSDVEVRIRTESGEVRWLRLQGVPETNDDEVVSFRGAVQDITERKEREQRLERVIEKLEASNKRLEQFAYAASHDLQEPLRMVSSYLQLIEDRYADALDENGEEFLQFAVDGADRMRGMIKGLLAYSRVETQGNPPEPIDLDAVFEDVLADLEAQIAESNAEVTADDLPRVKGDASQLRQVFQNLLENAITYSGDDPPRTHVSVERDGPEWIVSVQDEGIGIDPADADRIFDVFQRLHSHDEYNGTGIGLALCERIVERHGGDIWVDSEPGEGATFSFSLPAVQK